VFIYQVFATVGPEMKVGAVLAKNQEHALAKSVFKVKQQYGELGRIKRIIKVIDCRDVKKLKDSHLYRLINSYDQIDLVSYHLLDMIDKHTFDGE